MPLDHQETQGQSSLEPNETASITPSTYEKEPVASSPSDRNRPPVLNEILQLKNRAKNAEKLLLGFGELKPHEGVLIFNDPSGMEPAVLQVLKCALADLGNPYTVLDVSDATTEPETVPPHLKNHSFIWSSWGMDEAKLPIGDLILKLKESGCRMAYCPGFKADSLDEGGAATEDRHELETRLDRMETRLKNSVGLRIQTSYGTDLKMALKQGKRSWFKELGNIALGGEWGNFPSGEVFTTPDEEKVEGTLVLPFLHRDIIQGQGVDEFVHLTIRGGKIAKIDGGKAADAYREFLKKRSTHETDPLSVINCAEIAFGANSKARTTVVNPEGHYSEVGIPTLEAEKRLGTIHIAFGNSQHGSEGTDGHTYGNTHVDFVIPRQGLTVTSYENAEDFRRQKNGRRLIDQGDLGGLFG